MWVEEAVELFKGYLPYYLLVFLPIFIIISPANPVSASHEFPVYRMQHFDLHGVAHGCRSAAINLEARSLASWSTSRHCVVTKLQDLTIDHYRNIRNKAGGLLIILPDNLSSLTSEEKEHLLHLENAMLTQDISIPVYFATQTSELDNIAKDISETYLVDDKSRSAAEIMLSSIAANGYQIVINPKTPSVKQDVKIATLQGSLSGYSTNNVKIPTIGIVAHYDSFGLSPDLSFGSDSNGSGVIILLELVRLLSSLYLDAKTHGEFNIVFLLTGGGKLNYQGSKKWLEDQLDSLDGSIIQEAAFIMCLDTLASSNALYMHVSKPPKEGSAASTFFKDLKASADKFNSATVEGVHKKINLADDLLAWEHERYSIRRLPAFTLSTIKAHKDFSRNTILDTRSSMNIDNLVQNTQIIADALTNFIYNISGSVFGNSLKVERSALEAWIDYLSSQPRSAQLLANKDNALVALLKDTFSKYLRDIKITYAIPDKRDPDFVFYDVTRGTMSVHSVKPAFFDLFLTFAIIIYLLAVYFVIQNFPAFYAAISGITNNKLKKNN